ATDTPLHSRANVIDSRVDQARNGIQNLNCETVTPRRGLITVSNSGVVSKLAALLRVMRQAVMMGAVPTTTTRRPPIRSWYFRASGTEGTEPVTRIASYSVVPHPEWASPVS